MEKILFCDNAGYSNYSYKLCNEIANNNKQIKVVYLTDKDNADISKIESGVYLRQEIPVFSKAHHRYSIKWFTDRLLTTYKIIHTRNSIIRKEKANVVFLQCYVPFFDQFFIHGFFGYSKIVLTVHNVIPHEQSFFNSKRSLKRIYRKADHLIVHTEKNMTELIEDYDISKEKITVINHGTDMSYPRLERDSCRRQIGVFDEKPILLLYGGIRDYKGLDILIPACTGIDCHLVIAGKIMAGGSFNPYEELLNKHSVNAICYIDYITDDFTDILFQACDLVVFPYKEFHAQSGVFMQAIKYGKTVVATDVGSFKDFVEKYSLGYICKPCDVEKLHNTITLAIEKMGTQQRSEQLPELFSWRNSAIKYIELAENISDSKYDCNTITEGKLTKHEVRFKNKADRN